MKDVYKVVAALDVRIDWLLSMAESANEIYAERGSAAVTMGYTPDNFDFHNEATGYIRRANKLMERRVAVEDSTAPPPTAEEVEAERERTLEELPF